MGSPVLCRVARPIRSTGVGRAALGDAVVTLVQVNLWEAMIMQQTWRPIAGGILAIVAGSLNILVALAVLLFMAAPRMHMGIAAIGLLAIPLGILAVVAIAGGISALQRRHWGFALAGGICAIISPWWLLGVLSTVFVAISKEEFAGSAS